MAFSFVPVYNPRDICPEIYVPLPSPAYILHVNAALDHGVRAALRFIEAVQENPDDAWVFVSKIYAGGFNMNALREILPHAQLCQWIRKAGDGYQRGPFLTRSLYVSDPEQDMRQLVHLRMIREPDRHGIWKICAIDQEEWGGFKLC